MVGKMIGWLKRG